MADADFTSVYRQFFENFVRTEDPLPIAAPSYDLALDEMTGEIIELCIQYLSVKKCPQSLVLPLVKVAVEEINTKLKKKPERVHKALKVMQMATSKIDELCERYTDNEKLSSLPPPMKEPYISYHGIKHLRRTMEDRLVCLPKFNTLYNIPSNSEASYYGLFDGHCGSGAAEFAVSHLHQFLAESQNYPEDPVAAFREAYLKTDERYLNKELRGGTTALTVLHQIEEKKLIVSWVGDSQAMLVTQEGYLMLVNPHKPHRQDEGERIKKSGGYIALVNGAYRVNGQLDISRAIGDKLCKPFISANPEIRVVELNGLEEFFVIGCDGLWDVVKPHSVIEEVYSHMKNNPDNFTSVSKRLVALAKRKRSTDNISVIVVFLADPIDISKRSVEEADPWPTYCNNETMNTNFQTATEKSPFVPLPDQGMNRLYEENGRHVDYMDQLKDDSEEDFGPETDIDAVDDVLVSPNKCMNPFANDIWKKGGADCDESHELIGYSKQEGLSIDKEVVNFTGNINNFLKENSDNQKVEELVASEHMNQINSPYDMHMPNSDIQNIKISECSNVITDELIQENPEIDRTIHGDQSFEMEKDKVFGTVNDFSDLEKLKSNLTTDFPLYDETHNERESDKDLNNGNNQVLCNGNIDAYMSDKIDLEKPGSPVPPKEEVEIGAFTDMVTVLDDTTTSDQTNDFNPETNDELLQEKTKEVEFPEVSPSETCETPISSTIDSTVGVEQIPLDCENDLQKDSETPELLSPTIPLSDEKLKDDVVAESGGEIDSEDDEEWNYIKVGSGAPADDRIELVTISSQIVEPEKSTMNTPLNPNAAEFVPVTPVANKVEAETQNIPLRSVPPLVTDIIASSPNWNNMDNIMVPDEISFLSEIKTRPSNILGDENTLANDDMEDLGCSELNLDNTKQDSYEESCGIVSPISGNIIPQVEQCRSPSPAHGIALASNMTSSFIDPATMSMEGGSPIEDKEPLNQEVLSPKISTTLNVDAAEFKSELLTESSNKLPDLLSPLPVGEENGHSQDFGSSNAPSNNLNEESHSDMPQPLCVDVKSPVTEEILDLKITSVDEVLEFQNDNGLNDEIKLNEPVPDESVLAEPKVEALGVASVTETGDTLAATPVLSGDEANIPIEATTVQEKEEEAKKVATLATTKSDSPLPKVSKTTTAAKTPSSVTKCAPATKKYTTLTSKSTGNKLVPNVPSAGVKTAPKVSAATSRTVPTKPTTSNVAPRPPIRKTTTTSTTPSATSRTSTAGSKPLPSKPAAAPLRTSLVSKTAAAATAPKPKPRVPSAPLEKKTTTTVENESKTRRTEILTKKPGATSTVTTTSRTVTSRPASAPLKTTVKHTTTVTTTRTTTTKPRTLLTGVTTTTTTTSTRTVLTPKKPLSVTTKFVGNKPTSKAVPSKVNGLTNGNDNKTKTSLTSITPSKGNIENKTETKAENILETSVDMVENSIIQSKDLNLINGIGHE